ncbi:MAG: FAD-dependent oxidoreductase [Luteibacter sp.]
MAIPSENDPSSPMNRREQTFPHLNEEMAARLVKYGVEEAVPAGTMLFERGQRRVDYFFVLEGCIEVYDFHDDGQPNIFVVHGPNQFTGEVDLFSDRQVMVNGRTGADSRLVRLNPLQFRKLISGEPDIGEIIMRAFILRRVGLIQSGQGGVTLAGSAHAADTVRLRSFLIRNGYPYRLLDTDVEVDVQHLIDGFGLAPGDCPVVIMPDRRVLKCPTTSQLADELGITIPLDSEHVHDVAVIGAGPAGLAAAVYAASEGLDTLVLESLAPGGQAGTSSKIENYLGFPTGISGQALSGRAQVQAMKFGAHMAIAREVQGMDCSQHPFRLKLDNGTTVSAKSVVIATGARYRKLEHVDYGRFEGQGIHYAATAMEATLCSGEEVVVVGGGNSAGQAAVFLARTVAHVHILVRGGGLAATMSDYLVQRIEQSPRITLHTHCQVDHLDGDAYLREVGWACTDGTQTRKKIGALFVMIGAEPNTAWLEGCLDLDRKGFVLTGRDADGYATPSPFATTLRGVFAVGDVRSGSIKRVASGVGEGSVVVQAVHRYLNPSPI